MLEPEKEGPPRSREEAIVAMDGAKTIRRGSIERHACSWLG